MRQSSISRSWKRSRLIQVRSSSRALAERRAPAGGRCGKSANEKRVRSTSDRSDGGSSEISSDAASVLACGKVSP
jgi:hypothetical protein